MVKDHRQSVNQCIHARIAAAPPPHRRPLAHPPPAVDHLLVMRLCFQAGASSLTASGQKICFREIKTNTIILLYRMHMLFTDALLTTLRHTTDDCLHTTDARQNALEPFNGDLTILASDLHTPVHRRHLSDRPSLGLLPPRQGKERFMLTNSLLCLIPNTLPNTLENNNDRW